MGMNETRQRSLHGTRRGFVAAALLCLSALMAAGCGKEEVGAEKILRPVRTEIVTASAEARVRSFAGVARSGLESELSFRVAGTVEEIPVKVGAAVERGQVLARLDPTDYELKVQEALAGRAQAEAGERNAQADYDRVRGLYENNNASLRELDGARATAESTKAQVEAAEKRLEQARQQVSYTTLSAPVGGRVALIDVDVNENVRPGQKVFLLTAGTDIEVEVALPGSLITEIEVGDPVAVTFDALEGRTYPARVSEAGVAAVGAATTFPVTVRLDRGDPDIRSGMAGEVAFSFGGSDGNRRILVPAVSVGEDRTGTFVFVLEGSTSGQGVVRRREVSVGELTADGIEILGGLGEGEVIVTAGVRRLSDGEEVRSES
jgi:multidrug efflux system membrane fusion protein